MSRALLTYTHNNTGNDYLFLGETKIKIDGQWYPSKTYMNSDLNIYTRSVQNFDESFTFKNNNCTIINRLKLRLIKYLLKSLF